MTDTDTNTKDTCYFCSKDAVVKCCDCETPCCASHAHNIRWKGRIVESRTKKCHNCETVAILSDIRCGKPADCCWIFSVFAGALFCTMSAGLAFPLYAPCLCYIWQYNKKKASEIQQHQFAVHDGDEKVARFDLRYGPFLRPQKLIMRKDGNTLVDLRAQNHHNLPQLNMEPDADDTPK